jgi:hypothetical protein
MLIADNNINNHENANNNQMMQIFILLITASTSPFIISTAESRGGSHLFTRWQIFLCDIDPLISFNQFYTPLNGWTVRPNQSATENIKHEEYSIKYKLGENWGGWYINGEGGLTRSVLSSYRLVSLKSQRVGEQEDRTWFWWILWIIIYLCWLVKMSKECINILSIKIIFQPC